ncbi:MAG: hypothetical protein JGK01_07050 [Microcoleus sp. PH2017_03_ELD_O_A]|nr:hypothetical protein [Microcoleus sp. PH2017_03_ELD_O_A]
MVESPKPLRKKLKSDYSLLQSSDLRVEVTLKLSTVNCQLSTVNCQLSTVNCQLSTVELLLVDAIEQPKSTDNPDKVGNSRVSIG